MHYDLTKLNFNDLKEEINRSIKILEEINNRGALRVCALFDRLPFSSRDTQNRGFQIELAEEIAKELNVDLEITWLRYRFHA